MANIGRTVKRWVDFRVHDGSAVMRSIPVNSINGVGLEYPEVDLTAWQDAIKGVLPDTPECEIEISGPFDTSAKAAAGTLSGSHTVLTEIVGGVVPLSLDIQIGIRHAWVSGEPQFGITATSTSGFLCTSYKVNLDDGTYTAKFVMYPGSSAPAWGTSAES